jgi:antitoxin (DNA-binding transcriptional repressor) of toxin-antitoxin stability system
LPDMKTVELKPREFHRRIGWALAAARRGVAVVIAAPGQPAVTLSVGRPRPPKGSPNAGADWDAHFAWLKTQPKMTTNPVDDLRAAEQR